MFRGSNPTKGFEPQQKGGITPVAAGDFARSALANPFVSASYNKKRPKWAFFIIIGGDDSVNKPFTTQLLGSTMS